jgi:hypothetical protein
MTNIDSTAVGQIQKDYEVILDQLLEGGMASPEAMDEAQKRALLKQVSYEDLEVNRRAYSLDSLTLRKILSFRNIPSLPTVEAKGGWDAMVMQEKEDLLWELGMNSKEWGWRERIGDHREQSGGLVFDKYIESNERTDVEWLSLIVNGRSMASMEAKLEAADDKSLYAEIGRLGGL